MRFVIILYLLIAFTFSFVEAYTPFKSAITYQGSDMSEIQSEVQAQAQKFSGNENVAKSFLTSIPSMVATLFKTMAKMTTFSFEVGGAPAEVNHFLRGFTGILSIIFWISVIKEVISLVPFGK